ncbi:MAG: cysteine desulfurase [Nannocystaceae bacterium]|nr:cysteine desulfurase [Nannocystaceae bacterium]
MCIRDRIYLDHNATTPVAESVRDAMVPWLGLRFGNPSSGHAYGRRAAEAVAAARAQVAALIGASPEQIVFTGGGTEADNLALRCSTAARTRVVTSWVEHPAVEEPARALKAAGWRWDRLAVAHSGRVDLARASAVLEEPAGLVSVILAQNETGVLQPVAEISALARAAAPDVIVHSDGAQAVGKVGVDVTALGVDLLTIVGHKLYGPCGIGALYIRRPGLVRGWALGGGQEQGIRPGTEPTAMVVGLGAACELAANDLESEGRRQAALRDALQARLCEGVPGLRVTGHGADRLPNTLHVCVPDCVGAEVLLRAPQLAASTGSACHADGEAGILHAMGIDANVAQGALRLSLGRRTTLAEVERAGKILVRAWSEATGASSGEA